MSDEKKDWDVYFSRPKDDSQPEDSEPQGGDIPISKYAQPSAEAPYTNDYEGDLADDEIYSNRFSRFWLRKNKRNLKRLFVIVLLLALAAIIAFILIVNQKLGLIDYDSGVHFEHADRTEVSDEEDLVFTPVHDVADASSLKDWLQKWALNGGQKLHSKNVINCLLCGVDTEEGSDGRTDAMILVSLNKKTKKITLTSFMRDSYTYMNINGQDRWYKINSTYNWGGAMTLVQTIENNYKVEIDNYVTVDFDTFPKLIDALGGVEVDVEEYEARYIRRTSSHKKFPYGEGVRLNGDQALIYSRIRKSDADGDLSRTRRQRKLVTALIDKAQSASIGQLNNMLNLVLPYVQTNYRRAQILALATQALMQDWMSYDMEQLSCPLLDVNEDGSVELTGKDSYMMTGYGSIQEFVWIVDYQLDAQRVQKALYGMTNIEVHDDVRESPFDFLTGSNRSTQTTRSYYYETTTRAWSGEEETPVETTTRLIDRFRNPFENIGDRLNPTEAAEPQQPQQPEQPPADPPNSFEDDNHNEEPLENSVFTDN
ncbi:MAG: LCP family protein [Clostridia bacterium]|nr:LCP family protein [Clostridia bacterium]